MYYLFYRIENSNYLTNLEELNVNRTSISTEGVYHLSRFIKNKKTIKKLLLSDNQLKIDDDTQCEIFSRTMDNLKGLNNLEEIDISRNAIKDGCKYLEDTIQYFTNLKSLNISSIILFSSINNRYWNKWRINKESNRKVI